MSLPHWFSLIWDRIFFSSVLTNDGYNFFIYVLIRKISAGKAKLLKKIQISVSKSPDFSSHNFSLTCISEIVLEKSRISCEWAFLIFLHHLLCIPRFWYEKFLNLFFFLGFLLGRRVSAALSDSEYLSRDLPVIFDAIRFNRNQISSSEILHMLPANKNRESGRGTLVPRQRRSLQNGAVLSSHRDCYRVRMRVLLIWLNLTIVVAFLSEKRSHGQK